MSAAHTATRQLCNEHLAARLALLDTPWPCLTIRQRVSACRSAALVDSSRNVAERISAIEHMRVNAVEEVVVEALGVSSITRDGGLSQGKIPAPALDRVDVARGRHGAG